MAYIEFENVEKEYKMGEVSIKALNNTNFQIEKGELVVIVGPSGAGKTTSLNILGGVGKVNAARTTQIMIDKFNPSYVINVGTAGGLTNELKVKDIVIGKDLVQHDFDITGVGNYEKGEIARTGKFFKSDENLVKLCKNTMEEYKNRDFNIKIGRIVTGDWFASNLEKSLKIQKEFNADCIEMEGAAIAQVCTD